MKKVPLPVNINTNDFNTHNIYEHTPYIIADDKLIIDKTWWKSIPQHIRTFLNERLKDKTFTLDDVKIPHANQHDHRLSIVRQAYQDGYDYHVWFGSKVTPPGVKMIKLSLATK